MHYLAILDATYVDRKCLSFSVEVVTEPKISEVFQAADGSGTDGR